MATLFDTIVRHQIYLEGLKKGQSAEVPLVLGRLDHVLRTQLAYIDYDNLGDMNKTQLNKLLVALREAMRSVFNPWLKSLYDWLERYITVEVENFAAFFGTDAPEPSPMFAASKSEPMGANGLFWVPFLNGSATYAMMRIERLISNGYANRQTKAEVIAAFLGTKNNRYRDGIGRLLDRSTSTAVGTVIQHLSSQVNITIAKKVFGTYEWVSVLDDGTTEICRDRDGNVYVYGHGPVPPAHVGCRSSTVPADGREPTPELRFNMWASQQPAAFVNDAFDGQAPSRYEGSAALSLEQFKAKRPLMMV